jgi:hypothetical protein
MKLTTFINQHGTRINQLKEDYVNNNHEALKMPLQEFFSQTQILISTLRAFDLADINERQLNERINKDEYTNVYDKEKDEVEATFLKAQKFLYMRDEDRVKKELALIIQTIDHIKGV